jgi:hypothetical protein
LLLLVVREDRREGGRMGGWVSRPSAKWEFEESKVPLFGSACGSQQAAKPSFGGGGECGAQRPTSEG